MVGAARPEPPVALCSCFLPFHSKIQMILHPIFLNTYSFHITDAHSPRVGRGRPTPYHDSYLYQHIEFHHIPKHPYTEQINTISKPSVGATSRAARFIVPVFYKIGIQKNFQCKYIPMYRHTVPAGRAGARRSLPKILQYEK